MGSYRTLTVSFGKGFFRERGIIVLLISLPIFLISMGKASALDIKLPLVLDGQGKFISAESIGILLYSITAVVFVASLASFFIVFNFKSVIPRLNNTGYSNLNISMAYISIILVINVVTTIVVWIYTSMFLDIDNIAGYLFGLFFSSFIFSTIGLIIAEVVNTKTLGIYLILTVAMLDTAFLENPAFSRRYDESWMFLMPSNASIKLLIRATFSIGNSWTTGVLDILIYELILIVIYYIVRSKFSRTE